MYEHVCIFFDQRGHLALWCIASLRTVLGLGGSPESSFYEGMEFAVCDSSFVQRGPALVPLQANLSLGKTKKG